MLKVVQCSDMSIVVIGVVFSPVYLSPTLPISQYFTALYTQCYAIVIWCLHCEHTFPENITRAIPLEQNL